MASRPGCQEYDGTSNIGWPAQLAQRQRLRNLVELLFSEHRVGHGPHARPPNFVSGLWDRHSWADDIATNAVPAVFLGD